MENYDFSGWATRNDIRCADGRVIRKDAFKDCDGLTVPLVYNHSHNDMADVIGHALLENREEGVYTYGVFNNTPTGQLAKELVRNKDVTALSIYANKLKQNGHDVIHGAIREVSLVLAGANPGAFIDTVLTHSEEGTTDAVIYNDESEILCHSEEGAPAAAKPAEAKADAKEEVKPMAEKEKTVGDVLAEMTEEQRNVLYALVGMAMEENGGASEEDDNVKHNVFDNDMMEPENVLSHSEMAEIFADARRYGSLKDSVLAHGITDIENLFPEVQMVGNEPDLVKRDDAWVSVVMNSVHHTPFSRIKSTYANITADEARAKGYVKGTKKVDEVIVALKRETTPTTIYKKQTLDRDDVIDITDFDVVSWLKAEMRGMLNEEIARAILIGDGRQALASDKISETNIRPIWSDNATYTINKTITASGNEDTDAKAFIRAAIKSRKEYKGSGNPILFCTEDMLTACLLLEDGIGHPLYDTMDKLATAMRVSKIVTVPVMEGQTRQVEGVAHTIAGIIVNLKDYNIGADKGGNVSMFDDFDIDYNQQKYLIETRCSGALIKPFSAIAIDFVPAGGEAH